ncbi:tRNA threonylcarbamoyladenosine dehydratase [Roseateles koreensis]|uniref:tRNA threonylcarbamoyladenosine dehydratase n=1 Tax=Roseateles koreensis TaxID=2987526 RepID=A0ABT5KRD2_9BURK|nr:tRNA threonylcarbamoyladenosine dehydratase [Roseateles koreensis]MDC8784342.1 tRNA threonylcarbamoyladenosine dehydratase [Roseateles koreensis]
MTDATLNSLEPELLDVDAERRFGGLRRLYGDAAYQRLRAARVVVVGLGGVGSWAVEALARSGVAALTLIDLDQVAESNINRQVQALSSTVGMAKVHALRLRIHEIHPACEVRVIEEFVEEGNWPGLLGNAPVYDGVIDACDQVRAKAVMAAWARAQALPFVTVGAAGGKRQAHLLAVEDLADVTHDPLSASLRQRLRQQYEAPRKGKLGLSCVFSRESVHRPEQQGAACDIDGSLNCHGYGSSVMVTASFGMAAAAELVKKMLERNFA